MRFWKERQGAALSRITARKEGDGREGNGGTRSATTEEGKRDSHREDLNEGIIKEPDKPNFLVGVRGGDRK
jgi:hypothetical protein